MEWDGLFVAIHPDVYVPGDDTFLLARAVADAVRPGDRFLEVGCGAGLVAMVAARAGAQVAATDLNPHAVRLAAQNAKQNGLDVTVVETDLMAGVGGPFDVVAFNPPYLPTDEEDHVEGPLDLAFDGGADGNDVALRFVGSLAKLPTPPRDVLIAHSSLSDPEELDRAMKARGFLTPAVSGERHFFETITVRRFAHPGVMQQTL